MDTFQQLERVIDEYWEDQETFIVMPNSIRARTYLSKITKDIKIEAILDNDKSQDNTVFKSIPIQFAPEFLACNEKKKILISSRYTEIAEQLIKAGYQEYIDFIDMHFFVSMWYWKKKREIHLLDVHTAVTTYCSLNCKNCNMFINHYRPEQRRYIGLEEFKENFDVLFQKIDYCYKMTILGGEPLLNKELAQMINWLFKKYGKKIGEISVVTNGTILPQENLLDTLRDVNAQVNISDYAINTLPDGRIEKLEEQLQKKAVSYKRNKEKKWKNFYFPRETQMAQYDSERGHMLCCNPVFRGINDKKFYYCHIVWSAVQAGLIKEESSDYIKLEDIHSQNDREKLLEHDLGFVENGYVSLCKYCGGCGFDNKSVITAGIQE